MPSTYTPSLKIQEIANGDQSGIWGTTTNTNWSLAEQAITGVTSITMTNANYVLSSLNGTIDEARSMVIFATGSLSAPYQIVAPLEPKMYIVVNATTGNQYITFGGATGYVVTVPNSNTVITYCDGTNFYPGTTCIADDLSVLGQASVLTNISAGGNATILGNAAVSGNLTVTGNTNIIPISTVLAFPLTIPAGFLECDGAAVSRGTYAALFAVIGTTFGVGDGLTTFNLPNLPPLATNINYVIKY